MTARHGAWRLCPALALSAWMLAGCAPGEDFSRFGCPNVVGINELSRQIVWQPGAAGRGAGDTVAKAEISQILPSPCTIDRNGVSVEAKFEILAVRGPASPTPPEVMVEYFVAVLDPQQRVLGRQRLTTILPFASGKPNVRVVEDVQVRIPTTDRERVRTYSVAIGFQIDRARAAEVQRYWR